MLLCARLLPIVAAIVFTVSIGPVQAQSPTDAQKAQATELHQQAERHYRLGEYGEAITAWREAYKLTGAPLFLYNIAQSYRLSGDCSNAVKFYKSYTNVATDEATAAEAREHVAEMEPCPASSTTSEPAPSEGNAQPTEVPPTSPEPGVSPGASEIGPDAPGVEAVPDPAMSDTGTADTSVPGRSKRWIGWSLVGVGALSLGVGAYYGREASTAADDVADACAGGCAWADVADRDAAGRRAETRQWIGYGIGLGAVVGGVVLLVLDHRDARAAGTDVEIAISPTTGGVAAGATWTW